MQLSLYLQQAARPPPARFGCRVALFVHNPGWDDAFGQSIVFGGANCCHNLSMNMGVVPPFWPNRINNSPDTSRRAKSFNLIKPVAGTVKASGSNNKL